MTVNHAESVLRMPWAGPLISAAFLALAALPAGAQLQVGLKLESADFIQYEAVNAFVTLVNDTDDLVILGSEKGFTYDTLDFAVKYGKSGEMLTRTGTNAVLGKTRLMPDDKRELLIDISRLYDLSKMGNYIVSVMVDINGKRIESKRVAFDVVSGIELASVRRGLAEEPDTVRKYALRYWSRQRQEYLFLVVEDPETKQSFGVFNLGPFTKVTKPTIEADRTGKVTVVHQLDRGLFVKSVFKATRERVTFVDSSQQNDDGDALTGTRPPEVKLGPGK
ncbi:MAG: hypothetical protein C0404_00295 [Verrucomicrobia bacterium]|nr:hypothetical protein [Verrucomicrobiota bacterium]